MSVDESEKWKKRLERERAARREAEHLLEHKSLELYEANNSLAQEVARKGSELEEREQLFRSVFYASMDGGILLSERGRILEVNQSLLRMLGVVQEHLVGKGGASLCAQEDRLLARNSFKEVVKTGYCRFECDLVRADGTEFPAEIVGSRAKVGGEMIINGVIRDVTKKRRNLVTLREAYDEAERANQAKSLFLASMSHEIRTPLNGILGFTELVLGSEVSEEQRRHLDMVKSSGDILIEIIHDLLDFSKIESGQLILEDAEFDVEEMLKEVLTVNSPQALEKNLEVSLEVEEGIPQMLKGDLMRVRQVVMNLVANAIKFTEEGFVKINAVEEDGWLRIAVADSGVGIEEEKREMLFDAFSQADASTTRRFGGTGLGLAICRTLARTMGGDVEAYGELGEGSRFVFSIPLREGDGGEGALIVGAANDDTDREEVQYSVLIAEDNTINARLLTIVLQRLGHEVHVAKTGGEVLELLRGGEKFDLILMDRHMPEMDGVEATRKIRAGEAGDDVAAIPVIAVTASALEEDREACLEAGMNAFLAKPLRPTEVEQVLRDLL